MEPDRARAIAQVASVVVDTARVEVEYLKVTDGTEGSDFMPAKKALPPPAGSNLPGVPAPGHDNRVHRLK